MSDMASVPDPFSPLFPIAQASLSPTQSIETCENEVACSKPSHFPCHHCSKRLCLGHINEHNNLNIKQVIELSNKLNDLTDSLSNVSTAASFEKARNKIDTWKKQMHDNIENTSEFHSNEINRLEIELNHRLNIFKENLRLKMSVLQTQLATIQKIGEISQQQLLPIEDNLNELCQCLESIRCEICVKTKQISFNNLIDTHNLFSYKCQLSNNTIMPSYQTILVENIKEFVSSKNNQSILWVDNQKQLHYIDQTFQSRSLTIPNKLCSLPTSSIAPSSYQTKTKDVEVIDIKWWPAAEVFLILSPQYLLSFEPKTSKFTQIPLLRYKDYPFSCISCLNDTSLYISHCSPGICIDLWKYPNNNSMNEPLKRWDSLTNNKTEWISRMNINTASHLGLLIHTTTINRRFELRDENLVLLRKLNLNNDSIDSFFPFRSNQWLIKGYSDKYYIYSTETHTYDLVSFEFPFGLQEFGTNTIVIGNKQRELKFCDI